MRVYLDMCSIQRPLDTRSQVRINLEAVAVLGLISLCEDGELVLIRSEAHVFEIERNPHPTRRGYALEVIARATESVITTEAVKVRAEEFNRRGIKPLDALHLASAVEAGAEYFCTCDDRLFRRANQVDTGLTRVVTPLELIKEVSR
jgi:predicted nucleic acid-binding protein